MPDIPNIVGHVIGPLVWVAFAALVAWYAVHGAIVERRERASVPERGRSRGRIGSERVR